MKTQLLAFSTKVNKYLKDLYGKIGETNSLTTTDKTLVGAINEVKLAASAGVDTNAMQEAIKEEAKKIKQEIVGGATENYDTLAEIEAQVTDNLGKKLSVDKEDVLNTTQKNHVQRAIGLVEQDFAKSFKDQL